MLLAGGGALLWARVAGTRTAPAIVSTPPQPPQPQPQPQPAPSPETVMLRIETTPPGAEVRQGDRVFGVAPKAILLPKSSVPAHLTFVRAGHETASVPVIPLTDDTVRVVLKARPAVRPPGKRHEPGAAPTKPAQPSDKSTSETLPNPYPESK